MKLALENAHRMLLEYFQTVNVTMEEYLIMFVKSVWVKIVVYAQMELQVSIYINYVTFFFYQIFFFILWNVQFREPAKLLLWRHICIRCNLLVLPTVVFESNSETVSSILLVYWTIFFLNEINEVGFMC